jgi:phage gp45-like
VVNAEPFTGFGFFSRPPSSGEPEAIVTSLGDASASVIVAVRDEKTRAAVVGDLKVGETAMYNAKAVVYAKDDGTIEARSVDGAATELSTKADLATLKDAITNATVVAQDGGASFKSTLLLALKDWPAGTKTFKAE